MSVRQIYKLARPNRNSDEKIRVVTEVWVDLKADRRMDPSYGLGRDWEYDGNSAAECGPCGWYATVADFTVRWDADRGDKGAAFSANVRAAAPIPDQVGGGSPGEYQCGA